MHVLDKMDPGVGTTFGAYKKDWIFQRFATIWPTSNVSAM
jgi:hypothetical protein